MPQGSTGMYGSLCLEDIFEGLISRGQDGSVWVNLSNCTTGPFNVSQKNGKHYVNIVEWLHAEPDQHGQNSGIHLSMEKGHKERGEKPRYIGNMRYMAQPQQQAPYNANPQYQQPPYQQAPQQWNNQPNAGPGGFTAPAQRPGPMPPPPPQYGPGPAQPNYGPPPPPPQYGYQQPQQPPSGPQPVTQEMIRTHNVPGQQPPAPPQQFGPPPPGAWTPAVDPNGKLPF